MCKDFTKGGDFGSTDGTRTRARILRILEPWGSGRERGGMRLDGHHFLGGAEVLARRASCPAPHLKPWVGAGHWHGQVEIGDLGPSLCCVSNK